MEFFIDGYNLMHAWGRISSTRAGEAFRRDRRRFLNDLADRLGPDRAGRATVVFDASSPPGDFPLESRFRGLALVFALGDENADARLERMIARHSHPRDLVVVSTDRRIRQAAARRRAQAVRSEEFLDMIERLARTRNTEHEPTDNAELPEPREAEDWAQVFSGVDTILASEPDLAPPALLTDAEIAALEREIEAEW